MTSSDPCAQVGLQAPEILLPSAGVPLQTWAVVACDQHTSEPEYWHEVERQVGSQPSTLKLIFPEVYLEGEDKPERIRAIHQSMDQYLSAGQLRALPPGFVLVQRETAPGSIRTGLVVALDLEHYDYRPGATSLVRATEGTIVDRLPPRMQVRRQAPLELPHIMVLIDDPEASVIEPLAAAALGHPLYDFDLMQHGGHVRGTHVPVGPATSQVATALGRLATLDKMQERYGRSDRGVFLYAMGDGNHSLATAKATWEELKGSMSATERETALQSHPQRYALVELVNVHDRGLLFEPIHRVIFDLDTTRFWSALEQYLSAKGARIEKKPAASNVDEAIQSPSAQDGNRLQTIGVCEGTTYYTLALHAAPHTLAVGSLQGFIDSYLRENKGVVDYIHGSDSVRKLSAKPGAIGLFLPTIPKNDLFKTVLVDGPLPRKAFSMGEAHEKRFYIEARRIR